MVRLPAFLTLWGTLAIAAGPTSGATATEGVPCAGAHGTAVSGRPSSSCFGKAVAPGLGETETEEGERSEPTGGYGPHRYGVGSPTPTALPTAAPRCPCHRARPLYAGLPRAPPAR